MQPMKNVVDKQVTFIIYIVSDNWQRLYSRLRSNKQVYSLLFQIQGNTNHVTVFENGSISILLVIMKNTLNFSRLLPSDPFHSFSFYSKLELF